jgi:hypothetical protein
MSDPEEPPESDDAQKVGRLLGALPKVTEFGRALLVETDRNGWTPVQATARGLVDRAVCWLDTLEGLNRTSHFQAHLTALRAMIEIVVDLGLLYLDPTRNDQLEAWERSARCKHAKAFGDYEGASNKRRAGLAKSYAEANAAEVDTLRRKYGWVNQRKGTTRHPMRWTDHPLGADVQTVHERFGGLELEELYSELYQYLCFQVHGSALAGMRGATGVDMLAPMGMALIANAKLAFGCFEFAMRLLGLWDLDHQKKLQLAQEKWLLRYGNIELV